MERNKIKRMPVGSLCGTSLVKLYRIILFPIFLLFAKLELTASHEKLRRLRRD